MLLSYLQQKMERIKSTKFSADNILRSYGIDVDNGKLHRDDADIRALFIHFYRNGQDAILNECIQAIIDRLEAFEEEDYDC